MIFYKTSSFGNDFIHIDENELPDPKADRGLLAREICDTHRAVGADGVVYYRPSRRAGVSVGDRARGEGFDFQVYNRDGGKAELSGNGMAGLAAVLFQRRRASSPLTLQSPIGQRRVERLRRRGPVFQLEVEIGRPDFFNRAFFPFLKDGRDHYLLQGMEFYPVSVGNPHAVFLCREPAAPGRLAVLGKKIESHPMFPQRVNVEFVWIDAADHPPAGTAAFRPVRCRVFFYERGVGPTLASSTGSAAVFAVLRRLKRVTDRLTVDCGAETISVRWHGGIFIDNFTRLVCRGEYFH